MESSREIEMMIRAASGSGALSRDAIHSLGSLAARSVLPVRRLEDVLKEVSPKSPEERDRLNRVKDATQNNSYLD